MLAPLPPSSFPPRELSATQRTGAGGRSWSRARVVEAATLVSEDDEATSGALESRKRARARRWRRRLLWHDAVLATGLALLVYGLAEAPVLAMVGYLVVLGESLLPRPTSTRLPVGIGRFGHLLARRHRPPTTGRRCRRQLKVLP